MEPPGVVLSVTRRTNVTNLCQFRLVMNANVLVADPIESEILRQHPGRGDLVGTTDQMTPRIVLYPASHPTVKPEVTINHEATKGQRHSIRPLNSNPQCIRPRRLTCKQTLKRSVIQHHPRYRLHIAMSLQIRDSIPPGSRMLVDGLLWAVISPIPTLSVTCNCPQIHFLMTHLLSLTSLTFSLRTLVEIPIFRKFKDDSESYCKLT